MAAGKKQSSIHRPVLMEQQGLEARTLHVRVVRHVHAPDHAQCQYRSGACSISYEYYHSNHSGKSSRPTSSSNRKGGASSSSAATAASALYLHSLGDYTSSGNPISSPPRFSYTNFLASQDDPAGMRTIDGFLDGIGDDDDDDDDGLDDRDILGGSVGRRGSSRGHGHGHGDGNGDLAHDFSVDEITYDDDEEDEFGLPTITSVRSKGRAGRTGGFGAYSSSTKAGGGAAAARTGSTITSRPWESRKAFYARTAAAPASHTAPTYSRYGNLASTAGGIGTGSAPTTASLAPAKATSRLRTNSADIAEERGSPFAGYPASAGGKSQSDAKILRPQYKEILRDPANVLNLIDYSNPFPDPSAPSSPLSSATTSPPTTPAALPSPTPQQLEAHSTRLTRINKFKRILQSSVVSLPELRDLAWSGIPPEVRAMTWQLLLGYLPANSERRVVALERKRSEYLDGVRRAFDAGKGGGRGTGSANQPSTRSGNNSSGGKSSDGASTTSGTTANDAADQGGGGSGPAPNGTSGTSGARGLDEAIWHQISIDVPRTNPHIPLYQHEATQRSLERILYVWAIRHPASGYVQGINDLVTPFFQVFLATYITDRDIESGMDPAQLPKPVMDAVEADTFWCLTKLLDGIQDNYIYAQPGIHRQVNALRDLTMRIDAGLVKHLEGEGVEFMQFSFRWMNCLLMREISIQNIIRMWDTYMAEEDGFSRFHLYVCAAFLVKWSHKLMKMDFQEIMMFLQALPTRSWTGKDIELLLSEAFIWQSLFQDASAHLRGS
ncbi:GTPase-activating protein [Ascosphaera acerosa]|nr:GTPase-activating protein [Ascosphaera acerosa]